MKVELVPLIQPIPPVKVVIELTREEARDLSRVLANTESVNPRPKVNAVCDALFWELRALGVGVGLYQESPFVGPRPTFRVDTPNGR